MNITQEIKNTFRYDPLSGVVYRLMRDGTEKLSNSLNAEVKVAKTAIELRDRGADIGEAVHLGTLVIGTPDVKPKPVITNPFPQSSQ